MDVEIRAQLDKISVQVNNIVERIEVLEQEVELLKKGLDASATMVIGDDGRPILTDKKGQPQGEFA